MNNNTISFEITNLTSKINVAFGGILGGLPLSPYAYSGAQIRLHFSPSFIVTTPKSKACITLPIRNKIDRLSAA